MVFTEFISATFQIITSAVIPFLFFLFRKDKSINFFKYIGFIKPPVKSIWYGLGVSLIIGIPLTILCYTNEGIRQAILSPDSVTGKLRISGLNSATICTLLITALLKTSLSEEIFFRGFLAKQLINKLGFKTGNLIQASIFGLMHFFLFWKIVNITPLLIIFAFTAFAGWLIGYVKEKLANSSIIPGWIAHGVGNTITYFILAFVI